MAVVPAMLLARLLAQSLRAGTLCVEPGMACGKWLSCQLSVVGEVSYPLAWMMSVWHGAPCRKSITCGQTVGQRCLPRFRVHGANTDSAPPATDRCRRRVLTRSDVFRTSGNSLPVCVCGCHVAQRFPGLCSMHTALLVGPTLLFHK